jgi:hypothetical protein
MDIFITIVVAVIVFAASQYVLKLVLDPVVELKKMADVSSTLLYHQSDFTNANAKAETCLLLKQLSSDLRSHASVVPFYDFLHFLHIFGIPEKDNLRRACHNLNWLSNNVSQDPARDSTSEIWRMTKEIGTLLNVETTY